MIIPDELAQKVFKHLREWEYYSRPLAPTFSSREHLPTSVVLPPSKVHMEAKVVYDEFYALIERAKDRPDSDDEHDTATVDYRDIEAAILYALQPGACTNYRSLVWKTCHRLASQFRHGIAPTDDRLVVVLAQMVYTEKVILQVVDHLDMYSLPPKPTERASP